jgi:hypothetical protein
MAKMHQYLSLCHIQNMQGLHTIHIQVYREIYSNHIYVFGNFGNSYTAYVDDLQNQAHL